MKYDIVQSDVDNSLYVIDEKTGEDVACVMRDDDVYLLGASPDLLECCKKALKLIYWQKENDQKYDAEVEIELEEAISQAERG